MSLRQLMDKTISIHRESQTPDGMGGFETTWDVVGQPRASVPARITPMSASMRAKFNQFGVSASHQVVVPGWVDIAEGDHLVYGNRTLKVNGVTNPSEQGLFFEVACEEVR